MRAGFAGKIFVIPTLAGALPANRLSEPPSAELRAGGIPTYGYLTPSTRNRLSLTAKLPCSSMCRCPVGRTAAFLAVAAGTSTAAP